MTTIYTARATSTGGRDGRTVSDDGKIDLKLGRPGSNDAGTNPEQLFASGYSACFGGAVAYIAQQQGVDTGGPVTVDAAVALHKNDDGFFISVALDVALPSLSPDAAAELVRTAHGFCPYSKATRGNIEVALKVNGQLVTG